MVGDQPQVGPAGAKASAAIGVLERKFKRRNNINSLPGLIREHARLIALMRSNEIALDRAEVMSRAYGRHREMVTALEERTLLETMQRQLAEVREAQGLPAADVRQLSHVIGDKGEK